MVLLSELQSRFTEIVRDLSDGDVDIQGYSSWKLKEKLRQCFGLDIVFISQPGKSDFVCSSTVTVGDALQRAREFRVQVDEQGECELGGYEDGPDDRAILHKAAGVLRRAFEGISFQSSEYAPSGELDVDKCKAFVPSILINFISWCTSKRHFNNASSVSESSSDSNLWVLAICHNIIALSCSTCTPISFGLGVQMHHEFGSKSLIDVLYSTGYSISYDEVRRFVTSVAKDQLSQSEVNIPRGISRPVATNPNSIVDAAIDNFDQNEDTLDGKCSTHSMAIALYQRSAEKAQASGIHRSKARSLDVSEYDEPPVHRYANPNKKPEPQKATTAAVFELKKDATNYVSSQVKDLIWLLTRNRDTQSVPAWSGFNSLLTDMSVPVATIRYLPFIHAPPSDISTIYTTLLKLVAIAKHLGQRHILVTADLAIYSKAQQIVWNRPKQLDGMVTMRLGVMHLIMAYIASIGKLFGDGGFLQVMEVMEMKTLSRTSFPHQASLHHHLRHPYFRGSTTPVDSGQSR